MSKSGDGESANRVVRIGGASAFITDSPGAARQLLDGGDLDYLVFDFLAEVTMAILAKAKARRPEAGYAEEFVSRILDDVLVDALDRGVRLVANAGGVNLQACRTAVEELARRKGVTPRVALVEGDDLMPALADGTLDGAAVREMDSGDSLPTSLVSANAYLGAPAIAQALELGADIVLTGRVVDSAVTLGPLMHEFGWSAEDLDRLAQGSLGGHIIECGAQATGGLFTDWREVPDWAGIGYPILECHADGSFVVTKPGGTGGLVSEATVAEQLLYEVGDPAHYELPDVICDFTQVEIEQIDADRVRVRGARGRAPSGRYKVSATYGDGYRCMAMMPVVGREARAKARRQAEAVLERCTGLLAAAGFEPFRASRIETLGAEFSYGDHTRTRDSREVLCKLAVEHEQRAALEIFAREVLSPVTSMSVGSTGWFLEGRPRPTSVLRLFSFLIDKTHVPVTVDVGEGPVPVDVSAPSLEGKRRMEAADTGGAGAMAAGDPDRTSEEMVRVPLFDVAWGRSGDKGNRFNVGVVARRPELLPWIRRALTPERLARHMAHVFDEPWTAGASDVPVERFDLPGIHALNFLFHRALGGGGMGSLRLDPLAKGMAQQVLEMEVEIPRRLVAADEST